MSTSVSSPVTFGTEITVIRQRFFVDYTSESKKIFTEEYTLMCKTINKNGIDNIFIKSSKLLPNLKIYDSDGTNLALVTNILTRALINNLIRYSTKDSVKKELQNLLKDIDDRKIFLLWIKLPHLKRFHTNESRVIFLEYEATKEETKIKDRVLEFHSAPHEVFYVVTPPNDYEFDKEEIEYYDSEKKIFVKQKENWISNKGDPYFFNENQDSVTIRIRPNTQQNILFTYSFKPKKSIIAFPYIALGLLASAAFLIAFSKFDLFMDVCHSINLCNFGNPFADRQIQYELGIITASLVVPRLIQNTEIRHSLRRLYLIPIAIGIIGIFL